MKLSNETVNILKNFANINTNILFREGSLLSSISTSGGVFARAIVAEAFPKEFGVYDLNSLLSLLTLMEDQTIEFGPKSLTVQKDNGKFEYFYSSPSILVAAPNKTIEFDTFYQFKLTEAEISTLMKAINIVGAVNLSLEADGSKVRLIVGDRKEDTSNSYTKEVGDSKETFSCHIAVTNFVLIPDNYTVTISKKKLMHFKGENKKVEYFIAMEPASKL